MKIYLYSLLFIGALFQSALSAQDEVVKKQLNDAMAERAVLMVESHKLEEKISKAWSDKNYTSPEIEKMRDRYQKLRFEMIALREKLKAEVRKLPKIQKKAEQVLKMHAKQKDLEKKIQELNK